MKTKIYKLFSVVLVCFFIAGCGDDSTEPAAFKYSIDFTMDNFGNLQTVVQNSNAHSGKMICHMDSSINYGFYYSFNIPDSLAGQAITCSVDAWARTGKLDNACSIACSVSSDKDSILVWKTIDVMSFIKNSNEWTNVNGVFTIPGSAIVFGGKINILCLNDKASSYLDIDDLKITYTEEQEQPD